MNAVNVSSRHIYYASDKYSAAPFVGVDRFVIEPVSIRVATKAPPRPIEQTSFRRLLDWLIVPEDPHGVPQCDDIRINDASVVHASSNYIYPDSSRSIYYASRQSNFCKPFDSKSESNQQKIPRIVRGLALATEELSESDESAYHEGPMNPRTPGVVTRLHPCTEL
eukprot:IDg14264t1